MCGVIVVDAGKSQSTNLGRDAYIMIIAWILSLSIWSFINFPTVIRLHIVCYFSREKPLVKSTAPGSLLYHIFLRDQFYLLLFSDQLIQKPQNTLLQFIIIYFISRSRQIYLSNLLQFYLSFYPRGIDNPFLTSGCKYLFFVCRSCLHGAV